MLLAIRDLTKTFPGTVALDGVSFELRRGEVHALLGENGAGKSTLIKCLTGVHQRDRGEIFLDGRSISPRSVKEAQELGIGTVYQEVNLLPNLTVAENLTFGRQPSRFGMVSGRRMRAEAEAMLAGFGLEQVNVDHELGAYSVAVQQVVAIARAVALSGKVLILDEPTASLDARETEILFGVVRALRERGLGIVFISHFLDQVFELTDRVTVLRNGCHIATEETVALDRVTLIHHMLGHELEQAENRGRGRSVGKAILHFEGLGRAGKIHPFNLEIRRGEVVGLAGLLGSGRTETADVLFGRTPPDSGTARDEARALDLRNPRAAIGEGFGYAPEDRKTDGIVAELSLRENIVLALQARRGWSRPVSRSEAKALAERYVRQLDIRTSDIEKRVGELSGGNQQKVVLARWLAMNPRFLILDEPTRGIDVGAHAEVLKLIDALTEEGMSILLISSELDELMTTSDRVIVVRDRRHVAELVGEEIETGTIVKAIAASEAREGTAL